jgi:ER lumen protein retaining receptor
MEGFKDKIKVVMSDPQTLMFELRRKKKDIAFWGAGAILTLIVYLFVSSKDYSFLLVLSSTTQMLSFIILLWKVYSFQNCSGLSSNSLICYSILLFSRLTSTLFFHGYLPSDTSGDWFYQLTEIVSLVTCVTLIYLINTQYRDTYDNYNDKVEWKFLAGPALLIALLVHTSLNKNFLTDVLWTFAMYLETVAIFPQINLFHSKGGQIESYTSHYVSLQGLSRLFSLLFWLDTYKELNDEISDSYSLFHSYVGYCIILSQVIQLIIMIDYYYLYFKSLWKGEKMNIINI